MGKVFATTSGKGGVGKSTVAVGLATAFCRTGKRVLLVDMDEGLGCLDLLLKLDDSAVFNLSDLLNGADFDDAVYPCPLCKDLFLIPAPTELGKIEREALSNFAVTASELYDIVIFDFPAGIDFSFYTCLPENTLFVTVAVPDTVSIRDAATVSRNLTALKLKSRLVINRFNYKQSCKTGFKNIDFIIDSSGLRLLGLVPESKELALLSVNHRLKRRGKVISAFSRIASRMEGNSVLLPKLKKI